MDKDKFIPIFLHSILKFISSLSFSLLNKPNTFSPSSVFKKGQSEELGGG